MSKKPPSPPTDSPAEAEWEVSNDHGFPRLIISDNPPKAITWACKPFLDLHGLSICVGPGGSGKSYTMTHLALHMAAGIEWFGHPVRKTRVAYLDCDGIVARPFSIRINSLMRGMDIDASEIKDTFYPIPPFGWTIGGEKTRVKVRDGEEITTFDSINWQGRESLKRFLKDEGIEFLFTDVLSSIHNLTESNEDYRTIVRHGIGDVIRETGVGICLLAHTRKAERMQNHGRGQAKVLTLDDARGGGELVNASDIGFLVVRMSDGTGQIQMRRNRSPEGLGIPDIHYRRKQSDTFDEWVFEEVDAPEIDHGLAGKVLDFFTQHAAETAGLSYTQKTAFANDHGLRASRAFIHRVLSSTAEADSRVDGSGRSGQLLPFEPPRKA